MKERSDLITSIRGELVGPADWLKDPHVVEFTDGKFLDAESVRRGPLAWCSEGGEVEEVLYFDRETAHRKYGIGLLHPALPSSSAAAADETVPDAIDTIGAEFSDPDPEGDQGGDPAEDDSGFEQEDGGTDDFEVTSPDVRRPSTIGISLCMRLETQSTVVVSLPQHRNFNWQEKDSAPLKLNGRYESCERIWTNQEGESRSSPMWRRQCAVLPDTSVVVSGDELVSGRKLERPVSLPGGSPVDLRVDIFPRLLQDSGGQWLLTIVLRNTTDTSARTEPRGAVLYQSYFEVSVVNGSLSKYPESQRPFTHLDDDEQSLALLYRQEATWGVGHGCAAGWGAAESPDTVFTDVLPAVEIPSMTPEIIGTDGRALRLSMRELASLSSDGQGESWRSLEAIRDEFERWISEKRVEANLLPMELKNVATRHMSDCDECLARIGAGIEILRQSDEARAAFRLTNLSMILQQIATKHLDNRPLVWDSNLQSVNPEGTYESPWNVYLERDENPELGTWRAFQIAFLLMSLPGVVDDESMDRETIDLIWFPTGGGKTEAYLGVAAFYMFMERIRGQTENDVHGTNVLMRYTLRMLTTQQFQRAASLICSMEFLRRNPELHNVDIRGNRFSLGLWIGGEGSPNSVKNARTKVREFRRGDIDGNPLVLTECPWCRAEIGRFSEPKPQLRPRLSDAAWHARRMRGVTDRETEGPLLNCPDVRCPFGAENHLEWLPIEVIDERIYQTPPSFVISTADKLAMIAFRPKAGALFGRQMVDGRGIQVSNPPGLIIQDELHLISGPLGTMYALYEGVIERLCSQQVNGTLVRPKIIASTATIRGADEQVKALYARNRTRLFPAPGLSMSDSFFGTHARDKTGNLRDGRLYLGIHASDYGSVLTTQVRAFSTTLFRPHSMPPELADPWWSLLTFYNSIRELGGAKTLFDSDIRSRLKFMFNREGFSPEDRRNLRVVEELTSRLSQSEIVEMMDRLKVSYSSRDNRAIDACLASSIIEVGVDIDRLSVMGVVGQPKTTSQYIQVTGRVGRRWWERPGLILTIYNPSKSRDRSHFEQFQSYHRRLYERVEPTTATPFAVSAIQRGLPGALLAWARQSTDASVWESAEYEGAVDEAFEMLRERCEMIQTGDDVARSVQELTSIRELLEKKWKQNPQEWERFPPNVDGEYLILWPGQYATRLQRDRGIVVPSSMRQVDGNAELHITQAYAFPNRAM